MMSIRVLQSNKSAKKREKSNELTLSRISFQGQHRCGMQQTSRTVETDKAEHLMMNMVAILAHIKRVFKPAARGCNRFSAVGIDEFVNSIPLDFVARFPFVGASKASSSKPLEALLVSLCRNDKLVKSMRQGQTYFVWCPSEVSKAIGSTNKSMLPIIIVSWGI
jgi:hypothetical protein